MRLLSALLGLVCIVFYSCKDESITTIVTPQDPVLEIVFKARYNDQPLVFAADRNYPYFDGSKINFTKSELFVYNFELINGLNSAWSNNTLYFINFQNQQINLEKAEEGYKIKLKVNATGDFSGLRFRIGLPPEMNAKNPSDFNAGHLLADGEHSWAGWNSYIFSKTEGYINNDQKSSLFAYHSGFNDSYRIITINRPLKLENDRTYRYIVELDHKSMFGNDASYVNVYEDNIFHDAGGFMKEFMDHYEASFR